MQRTYQRAARSCFVQDVVHSLTPGLFRELIALVLERLGYTIENNPTAAELVVTRDGKKAIVICATPSDPHPAGTSDVARLHEVVLAQNAQRGVYVTTRSFTLDAADYAASMPAVIKLLDGPALQKWLNKSVEGMTLPTQYKAMCHVCGEIVEHNLDHGKPLPCTNEHTVAPTIALAAIERARHPRQPDGSGPKLEWRNMSPKAAPPRDQGAQPQGTRAGVRPTTPRTTNFDSAALTPRPEHPRAMTSWRHR